MNKALDFFNSLMGTLDFELTDDGKAMKSVDLELWVYDDTIDDRREITQHELELVVIEKDEIWLSGEAKTPVLHKAPNGKHFTVHDLLIAVRETERETRAQTKWFGDVDDHHTNFEGVNQQEGGGDWYILWGS
jgi:hypothetical protein